MTANHGRFMERIKTILIVVLTLTTILLLYFFWKGIPGTEPFQFKNVADLVRGEEYVPEISQVLLPREITVSFVDDKGSYTSVEDGKRQYWNQAISELKLFGKETNVRVQELSDSQLSPREAYQRAMRKRSIQFSFSYDIPFGDFCDAYGIKRFSGSEMIQSFTSIGYSTYYDQDKSLLFYDGKNDKYYRIFADKDKNKEKENSINGFLEMIDEIQNGGDYIPYYPVSSMFLGEDTQVENNAFMPLTLQSKARAFHCTQEFSQDDVQKIDELAETFFGKNFDFIRRITESQGTLIFMYGYGQKVLTVNMDGTLVYKEEISEEGYSEQNFFDSLDTALTFVAAHGTWETDEGGKENPQTVLRDVTSRESGRKKIYSFTFETEIGGQQLHAENGNAAVVEVCGSQVIYYSRNMLAFDRDEVMKQLEHAVPQDTFPTVNMIAQNYNYITEVLLEDGILEQSDAIEPDLGSSLIETPYLEAIVGSIHSIQVGYIKLNESSEAAPAWVVSFVSEDGKNTRELYFDLYGEADPLPYSRTK